MIIEKTRKQLLNDRWKIDTDYDDIGCTSGYPEAPTESAVDISVPSIIQESFPGYYGTAWYWNRFDSMLVPKKSDRVFVRFGAVDYKAIVWLNGNLVGEYEGGESSFEFEVTSYIKATDNLLTVRVINTCDRTIDGLNITNTPNRNKLTDLRSGHTVDFGGMLGSVELVLREAVAITDVFTTGDIRTGELKLKVFAVNYTDLMQEAYVTVEVSEKSPANEKVAALTDTVKIDPGENVLEYSMMVPQHRLWEIDDPNLYNIRCTVCSEYGENIYMTRFGFREFVVKNGFFMLNGKRIFLKCAHSGNAQPIGIGYPKVKDFTRRDFINAKASNFNTVRVCAFLFRPEQLDFCDELGIMIMDECYAAWMIAVELHPDNPLPLGDSEDYLRRFDRNTTHMILQDRNHASVVMYEFLNETGDTDVFRRAVAFLPKARELDPSRLILLSSGRFDNDFTIGCVSNPYTDTWQHEWGADSQTVIPGINYIGPSVIGAGDVHLYPWVPHTEETYNHFLALGTGMRPVFLSEYGIGTQFNVIHETRMFEQYGASLELSDYRWVKKQSDDLKADFGKYGFDRVYPFPETMLNESCRLGARQRSLGFNLIRANPNICGFSITGLLDHGMCGEGLWSYWRRWKPEMFDAISDGFSPLRFCMFTYPTNAYSGRPFRIMVSLATEDVLRPGKYPVSLKVCGDCGTVWRRDTEITVPESMPFAVPVVDEMISLTVPTGKYTLYANLNEGGSPTGEKLDFYITEGRNISFCTKVYTWGIGTEAKSFLECHGINVAEFAGQTDAPIVVGYPDDRDNDDKWKLISKSTKSGQTALYIQDKLFTDYPELAEKTGVSGGFTCRYIQDHLYHKEVVPMPHCVFDGIRPGMFDFDYVGTVFPHEVLEVENVSDIICSSFLTGSIWIDGSYGSFYNAVKCPVGKGSVVINTLYVVENLGKNPIADRLLLNYIGYISGI